MRRLLILTVPLAVAGVLAATAFAALIASVDIDTYEAPSDGFAGPYFTPTLDAGQLYLMTVSGTYSFWTPSRWGTVCAGTPEASPQIPSPATTNGPVGVDPEYAFAVPSGSVMCPVSTPAHVTNLQISLDGGSTFTHLEPIISDFNATHSYQYFVVGLGVPFAIGFRIEDSVSNDNYGVLMTTVEAIDAGDDFDSDGLTDYDEVFVWGTLPFNPDTDADTVLDGPDNCKLTANPNQTNSDAANEAAGFRLGFGSPPPILLGDPDGDACDNDDDNDGFSDADEQAIFGVGPGSAEERTPCRTAAVADPLPPDIFGLGGLPDRLVDGQDLVAFIPGLFLAFGQPGYDPRLDIFQPGIIVDGQDLVALLPFLFNTCEPPP